MYHSGSNLNLQVNTSTEKHSIHSREAVRCRGLYRRKRGEAGKQRERKTTEGAGGGQRVALLYNKRITTQPDNPPTIQQDNGVSPHLIQPCESHP